MVFNYAEVGSGTMYVSEPKGGVVVLGFRTPDETGGFIIVEQQGTMGHLDDNFVEKVKINNANAEYANDERQFEPTLLWANGDVVCRLYTNDRSPYINEKGLIEIAESMKILKGDF
jgi:hypothetical protein